MKKQVNEIIQRVIASENQLREVPIDSSEGEHTKLFGAGGQLDSLGLVSLIVALEHELRKELDLEVSLANERAMSATRSPFATISTLANHVVTLATEAALHG